MLLREPAAGASHVEAERWAEPAHSPAQVSRRQTGLRCGILVALLVALRLPLLDHPTPVDIDEVSFIAGLGFPASYLVHHPGYPLWVAMGTLLHAAGLPPYAAYQVWSVVASIIGPLLVYLGFRRVLEDRLAWWLALAFGVCPLIWFQSATALSYLAGGVLGLLVVGLCYEALANRRAAAAYWAAVVLAVGVSLRADLLIYLGPMLAYVAWRFRWRQGGVVLLVIAAGVVGFVAWTSLLYGRADPTVVRPSLGHTIDVVLGTSIFRLGLVDGLVRNLVKIVVNLAWDFGVAVLLLPVAAVLHWVGQASRLLTSATGGRRYRRRSRWPSDVRVILLLWIVPITAFLALMHVVQGYFVLLAAAGYCLIGLGLQSRFTQRTATALAAAIALCSAVQFAAYPWSAEGGSFKRLLDAKIAFMSASGLRQIDRRADIHAPGDYWRTTAHDAQTTQPPIRRVGP